MLRFANEIDAFLLAMPGFNIFSFDEAVKVKPTNEPALARLSIVGRFERMPNLSPVVAIQGVIPCYHFINAVMGQNMFPARSPVLGTQLRIAYVG